MPSGSKITFLLASCAIALVVLGARWTLIERVGSPVPFQDQWYAEAEDLYLAAGRGGVPVTNFFRAHNDHRIVPTRMLAYALFRWNHQWDVRLQMAVNASLAAATCILLLVMCRSWLSAAGVSLVGMALAGFYALPVLYENALWGFQSQFYFLILFSVAHIYFVLNSRALSIRWWLAVIAGLAALTSMGSGLLAPVSVAAVTLWRSVREPHERHQLGPTAIATLLLTTCGILLLPAGLGASAGFQPGLFWETLVHALGFPKRELSFVGVLLWLPFFSFAVAQVRSRHSSPRERILLAVGAWVLLQAAAMGYARPETGPILANRYGDILAVGLAVNLLAGVWTWEHLKPGTALLRPRILLVAYFAAWLVFVGREAARDARIFRDQLEPGMVALRAEHLSRLRDFCRTHDPAVLASAAYPHIPVVDAPSLVRDLSFPEIAAILPFEIRPPIPLTFPATASSPSLDNSIPVSVPNEPGMLHRGTFFRDTEARGIVDATSDVARKDPRLALRFEIAGDFKAGESELRILDSRGNLSGVITNLKSDVLLPVTIDVPGKTFRLEVSDRSMTRWIAFLEPVEIGPLSRMTLKVLPWGTRCQYWGWTLLAILGVYRAATWRRRSRAG